MEETLHRVHIEKTTSRYNRTCKMRLQVHISKDIDHRWWQRQPKWMWLTSHLSTTSTEIVKKCHPLRLKISPNLVMVQQWTRLMKMTQEIALARRWTNHKWLIDPRVRSRPDMAQSSSQGSSNSRSSRHVRELLNSTYLSPGHSRMGIKVIPRHKWLIKNFLKELMV